MKTMILLMFSLFLFTGSLTGQNGKLSFLDRDINNDLNIANCQSDFRQIDTTFKLIPDHDLFHKRNSQRFDLIPEIIIQHHLIISRPQTYANAEEYPGSSIYYAKRPSQLQMTNEKFFIIKPDTTLKYYLVVKDPIRHTYTK